MSQKVIVVSEVGEGVIGVILLKPGYESHKEAMEDPAYVKVFEELVGDEVFPGEELDPGFITSCLVFTDVDKRGTGVYEYEDEGDPLINLFISDELLLSY